MRLLEKNKVDMYYALYDKSVTSYDENGDETGDPIDSYGLPVLFRAVPSVGSGKVDMKVFGADITFSRTIITDDLDLPIDASALVWIDTEPLFNADGTVDGKSADYVVSGKPMRSYSFLHIPLSQRVKNADNQGR